MFIGYYNIANLITLTGLSSSLLACFLAGCGNPKAAVIVFMIAGLCDMFDGRVARATNKGDQRLRLFGVQIDSLCDVVSFGVAPGIIAFLFGFRDTADIIIYILFACFGAIRLAYFNTQALTEADNLQMKFFTGMPIPTICFAIPPLALLMTFVSPEAMHWVFKAVYAIIGVSFIINVKIKKPGLAASLFFLVAMLACLTVLLFLGEMKTAL